MLNQEHNDSGQQAKLRELQASVDYAVEFANWVNQAPQAPTTAAAKGLFETIAGELQRMLKVAACAKLQDSLEKATDGEVLADNGSWEQEQFGKIKNATKDAMGLLGCSAL